MAICWDSHTYFFFGVTIVFDCITHRFVVIHPYTKVHTPRSIHQATFEDSNVHTPVYFYIAKNSKCPLFWYTYIKKPFRALKHTNIWTPEHQILCSNSVLRFSNSVLSFSSSSCGIMSIFSNGPIIFEKKTVLYYSLCTAQWVGLSIHFSRSGLDYLSIFPVVGWIIYPFFP